MKKEYIQPEIEELIILPYSLMTVSSGGEGGEGKDDEDDDFEYIPVGGDGRPK